MANIIEKQLLALYYELYPDYEKRCGELPVQLCAKSIEHMLDITPSWRKELTKLGLLKFHKIPFVDKVTDQTRIQCPREWFVRYQVMYEVETAYYEDVGQLPPKGWREKIKNPPKGKVVLPERYKQTRPPEPPVFPKVGIS